MPIPVNKILSLGSVFTEPRPGLGPGVDAQVASQQSPMIGLTAISVQRLVKPYVKTNKSDYIDAEAIAEAVQRPTMRFVPIKTEEHLDLQAVHRVRERWVMRRTAVVNQIRGLLLERGLTLNVAL